MFIQTTIKQFDLLSSNEQENDGIVLDESNNSKNLSEISQSNRISSVCDAFKSNIKLSEEEIIIQSKDLNAVGIDEVGYGSWAGPVVVCALQFEKVPHIQFFDSKTLSAKRRVELRDEIIKIAKWEIGIGTIEEINEFGLAYAYKKAIERAVQPFLQFPLFMDGRAPKFLKCHAIVKGDQKIQVISAASIVAKVFRDELMNNLEDSNKYDWQNNKGYGTARHIELLKKYGFSKMHRVVYNLSKYLA